MPEPSQPADPRTRSELRDRRVAELHGKVRALFHVVGGEVAKRRRRSRGLERVALSLSVLTSGAIWTMIADKAPDVAAWAGAAAATVTMLVLLYQRTFGPQKEYEELVVVLTATQDLLVQLDTATEGNADPGAPMDLAEKYRKLETQLMSFGLVAETTGVSETLGTGARARA